jgi:hypothetical protein
VAAWWKKQKPMKKRTVMEVERSLERSVSPWSLLSLTGRHSYQVKTVDTGATDWGYVRLCHAQDGQWRVSKKKLPALQEKAIGPRSVRVRAQVRRAEFPKRPHLVEVHGVRGVVNVWHVHSGKTSDRLMFNVTWSILES